jgi:hypothetical protein
MHRCTDRGPFRTGLIEALYAPFMSDTLPTPRTTLRGGYRLLVWCKACRRQEAADLQRLIDAGRGDMPLIKLRFRCTNCRSRLIDFVVTAGAGVRPW